VCVCVGGGGNESYIKGLTSCCKSELGVKYEMLNWVTKTTVTNCPYHHIDGKSVEWGESVDRGGRRLFKKKNTAI